jgi:hypothetical protein
MGWHLFIDETGDFRSEEGRVGVVGAVLRFDDEAGAQRRIKKRLQWMYPFAPYPQHACEQWLLVAPAVLCTEPEAAPQAFPSDRAVASALAECTRAKARRELLEAESQWFANHAPEWFQRQARSLQQRMRDRFRDRENGLPEILREAGRGLVVAASEATPPGDGEDPDRYLRLLVTLLDEVALLWRFAARFDAARRRGESLLVHVLGLRLPNAGRYLTE